MFNITRDVKRSVEIATDPDLRARSMLNLERKLKLNMFSVVLSIIAFGFASIVVIIDRSDPSGRYLFLLLGFMMLTSFMAYASNFNRLVLLKIEESRSLTN